MDASPQLAAQSTIEVEQHVRQLNDEWVKAVMRADGGSLDRIIADDFFFAYPGIDNCQIR